MTELTEAEIARRLDAVFDGGRVVPADRRWALAICGVQVQDIARCLNLQAPSQVSEVISGVRQGTRIRRAIARRVGVSVDRLWPEYFDQEQNDETD